MAIVTNFFDWVEDVDHENFYDVYCLYKALNNLTEWGAFRVYHRVTQRGSMYYVECTYIEDILLLGSVKTRDNFIRFIERKFAGSIELGS